MSEIAKITPEKAFLCEGYQSYHYAIHAINEFQLIICGKAKDILNDNRERISDVTNLKTVIEHDANDFLNPSAADQYASENETWLGAKLYLPDPQCLTLYLGVMFSQHPDNTQTVYTWCAIEASTKKQLTNLISIFRDMKNSEISDTDKDWRAIDIKNELKDIMELDEALENILDETLRVWSQYNILLPRR
jgi:hypothetical protein